MHIKALLMKFLMTTAVLWIILGIFYEIKFTDILMTSVVLTVVGFIGDMFVLPQIGNVLAAIVDFFLALVVVWLFAANVYDVPIALLTAAFVSALVIMMGELFLHRYMANHIFEPRKKNPEEKTGYYQRTDLQTEFAEEVDMDKVNKKDERKKK